MPTRYDPLDCACFNTRKIARLLGQLYDRSLEPSGLRNTQFTALSVAKRQGPISITDLAQAMDIERTSLTRNLQLLKRDGLVRIGPGADGRTKHVVMTAKGERRWKEAMPLWASAQEQVLKRFGEKRWKAMREELGALGASLPA